MKARSCLLCQSRHLTTALALKPTPMADAYVTKKYLNRAQRSYPLTLMLCESCGHVQLSDFISPQRIYRSYIYHTANSPGLIDHFRATADEVLSRIKPHPHALVVDIGSNDGTLLSEYKKSGMRVLGIDPARAIARKATRSGITTIPEFISKKLARTLRQKYGQAAIITANNVYANVDDMDEFVGGVKELLAPDGVFIFESFYVLDVIRHMVFDFAFHEHLSYFSLHPLMTFFHAHDMEIIDVTHLPTKGGSLRVAVQRTHGPRKVSRALPRFLSAEKAAHLRNIQTFRTFEKSITQKKHDLGELLKKIKKEKKSVAGFGAAPSCTTLMYHFDLTHTLSFLIDENPIKINTYSPGAHLRVFHPDTISTRKPDYIIILAWRFAKQIIAKNINYLNQGGHFIIPLPTLTVI